MHDCRFCKIVNVRISSHSSHLMLHVPHKIIDSKLALHCLDTITISTAPTSVTTEFDEEDASSILRTRTTPPTKYQSSSSSADDVLLLPPHVSLHVDCCYGYCYSESGVDLEPIPDARRKFHGSNIITAGLVGNNTDSYYF